MTGNHPRFWAILLVVLFALTGFCYAEESDWYEGDPFDTPQDIGEFTSLTQDPETPVLPVFSDVQETDWFYDNVMTLWGAGVINGYPDGSFRPQNRVTVAEAYKMILLATGFQEQPQTSAHWASGYADFIYDAEFLKPRDGLSNLDAPIRRATVCELAANALGLQRESEESVFTDTDDDSICALHEANIISGYPDGTARPNEKLTRAELSAIVDRIYKYQPVYSEDPSGIDEEPIILRTTEAGVDFIKAREGFAKFAAWDYMQYSIGYGSRCEKNEYPDGISEEEADHLLRVNIAAIEKKLDAFLEKNDLLLPDSRYDALVSFTYNNGSTWMSSGSRLAVLLEEGGYTNNEFASAFGIWCHVTTGGEASIKDSLITRRIMEINLFLYGDYSGRKDNFFYLIFDDEDAEIDIAFYEAFCPYQILFPLEKPDRYFIGWVTESGELLTEESLAIKNLTVTAYCE